ncbi:MAG: phage Gp37/Gp68 family protein [Dehalococcoidia bacterium]|nr:phage Gp37/Gp68 family protein [Dehalococcoidia bacterium]
MAATKTRHQTGIQWTHVPGYVGATWNPTTGCTRVSPGCDHCYAFTLHDQRYAANRGVARQYAEDEGLEEIPTNTEARALGLELPMAPQYDVPFSRVQVLDEHRLTEPMRAKKPRAYFVDSMSDLFHEDVQDEVLDRVFAVMALSPQHIFMILTKRPERMRAYITGDPAARRDRMAAILREDFGGVRDSVVDGLVVAGARAVAAGLEGGWRSLVLGNVWLGVSVEDQERADERIPLLLDTPAAVRFLSCEPLLGPVDLTRVDGAGLGIDFLGKFDALEGITGSETRRISWVIVGGESGKGARPFEVDWARDLRDQCQNAGVAFFMKQLGARVYDCELSRSEGEEIDEWPDGVSFTPDEDYRVRIKLKSQHGSHPEEWPEDLRVREFPTTTAVQP